MPPCQHTFCKGCLEKLILNNRATQVPCPVCRQPFRHNHLQRNILAYQLINELEIYCANRGCQWKGPLDHVAIHLPKCSFSTGNLPEWVRRWLASKESEF